MTLIDNKSFWQFMVILVLIILSFTTETICKDVTNDVAQTLHQNSNKHLIYISNLFEKNKINYWLMSGTLLGAVKYKKLIYSDPDIDIGANIDDSYNMYNLNTEMAKSGYFFRKTSVYATKIKNVNDTKMVWNLSYKLVYNNKEIGEIIFYTKCKDGFMRRIHDNVSVEPSYYTFPSWFVENNDTVIIDGNKYRSPKDPHILLEYWYGKKWQNIVISKYSPFNEFDSAAKNKHRNLSFLINHVAKNKLILVPKFNDVTFVYPKLDIEWIKNNDPVQ
jgi:hypothetical protein